jgi:hypothetical protein
MAEPVLLLLIVCDLESRRFFVQHGHASVAMLFGRDFLPVGFLHVCALHHNLRQTLSPGVALEGCGGHVKM